MKKRVFLFSTLVIAALLAVTFTVVCMNNNDITVGASSKPSLLDAPSGPLDMEAAIQKATVIARVQGMEPRQSFAELTTYQAWARTMGAELGPEAGPERQVWVVVLCGDIQRESSLGPVRTYDNYEVVLDKETGEYLASGSRNPGVPPPFPLAR
jgi:hypothetical protein